MQSFQNLRSSRSPCWDFPHLFGSSTRAWSRRRSSEAVYLGVDAAHDVPDGPVLAPRVHPLEDDEHLSLMSHEYQLLDSGQTLNHGSELRLYRRLPTRKQARVVRVKIVQIDLVSWPNEIFTHVCMM